MYPQILYWKWNDDILKEGELERKAQDIFNRSIFDTIYVSLHSSEHSASYPEIKAKIKKFSEILNERGKKLVMDLDMRREHEKCKSYGYLNCERMAQHTEAVLDENGSAVFVPGDDRFEETEVLDGVPKLPFEIFTEEFPEYCVVYVFAIKVCFAVASSKRLSGISSINGERS